MACVCPWVYLFECVCVSVRIFLQSKYFFFFLYFFFFSCSRVMTGNFVSDFLFLGGVLVHVS